jgi:TRAP-type C4-dicarboxylate transport system permease small subunit
MALAQFSGSPTFAGTASGNLLDAVVTIVNIFLLLAGLVAAIFLIIGGVRYITSQGDEDAAGKAKQTVLYAVIGLIVIGLSAAIVNFVIGAIQSS